MHPRVQRTGDDGTQTGFSSSKHDDHGLHEHRLSGHAEEVPNQRHCRYGASHTPKLHTSMFGIENAQIGWE